MSDFGDQSAFACDHQHALHAAAVPNRRSMHELSMALRYRVTPDLAMPQISMAV